MRTPALLRPTTTERVLLPSGREEALPKTTPRFLKWTGEFPWSTYGGKPILDLDDEPLYAGSSYSGSLRPRDGTESG